jgi:hypothetical protein
VRPILTVIAVLLLCAPAQARERAGGAPGEAATKAASEKNAPKPTVPMVFYIAKGEPDACGRGCGEWIAADGQIDGTTPGRLRALLVRTGARKLPIYFYSPGGSVTDAIEIGRLMRAHDMTAGVARTIPQGCDPRQDDHDSACEALKRSGRELQADLRTLNVQCNSACVYALIGAKVREVAADVHLGVHRISGTATTMRRYSNGKVEESSPLPPDAPVIRAMNGHLTNYAVEMGVSGALVAAATAIPHERLRFITRDEIARFGIDRREFVETRWIAREGGPGAWSVMKTAIQSSAGEPKRYRSLQLVLLCGRAGFIGVRMARDVDPADVLTYAAIASRGTEIALTRGRTQPKSNDDDAQMEIWFATAPKTFFENAASRETFEFLETPSAGMADTSTRRVTLSTFGLAPAIGAMQKQCR